MKYILVAAMFSSLLSGPAAFSIVPSSRFTMDVFETEGGCTGDEAEDCDIQTSARGDIRTKRSLRPLFVKFKKVGGTTLMELVNAFTGVTLYCGRECGECPCIDGARACTGHDARAVLVDFVVAAEQPTHNLLPSEEDVSVHAQLIPMADRRQLFTKLYMERYGAVRPQHSDRSEDFHVGNVPLSWVPHDNDKDAVAMITVLRNPLERMRSYYYYVHPVSVCQGGCDDTKVSFITYMNSGDLEVCCEYVTILGRGSVTRAKRVLATMFDVVGITEEMDDAFVDVANLFEVPLEHLPKDLRCRDNRESKKDWTSDELEVAQQVAADDIEIYNFARDLKKKRRENSQSS